MKSQQAAWEERVNYSSIYDCVFIHIPKTAGSSVANLLGLEVSSHLTYQEFIRTAFYRHNPHLRVFAIVRDPLARFLSLYNYARMPISPYHNNIEPSKAIYGAHADFERLSKASLNEAIDDLVNNRLVHDKRWNQWLPQAFWVRGINGQIDPNIRLIHLEQLSSGLADLLGTSVGEIPHLNPSPAGSESIRPSRLHFAKLVNYYHDDYEQLGYEIPCN